MTISEYEVKLIKLANFVTSLDRDDTRKAGYFERGLIDNNRNTVKARRLPHHSDGMQCARVLEQDCCR